MSSQLIHDPKLYRELSQPFASVEAASEALDKFNSEVRELRSKYRIPDVVILTSVNIDYPDGEASAIGISHHGSPAVAQSIASYAAGYYAAEAAELTSRTIAAGKKAKVKK